MKTLSTHPLRAGVSATLLLSSLAASATTVAPPPLPMGSAMAKPQVGASPTEEKRAEKAHKQPSVLRRNHLHDDSLAPPRQGAIPRATVSVPRDSK